MSSSQRFTGSATLTVDVDVSEEITIALDDQTKIVNAMWTAPGQKSAGGTGYGTIAGTVPAKGTYVISIVAAGPGTVVVAVPPPLPS